MYNDLSGVSSLNLLFIIPLWLTWVIQDIKEYKEIISETGALT